MSTEKTTIILELTAREADAVRLASVHSGDRTIRDALVNQAGHEYLVGFGDKNAEYEMELTDAEARLLINYCTSRAVVRVLKKVVQ